VIETPGTVCGNFPKTHPLYLGSRLEPFMATTDLVLLVACRAPWYPPSNKPTRARTVVIDETPQRPHMVHQRLFADLYLEGEVASTLGAAVARAPAKIDEARRLQRINRHAAAHRKLRADIEAAEAKVVAGDAVAPAALVKTLRDVLSNETIYVDETITHARV